MVLKILSASIILCVTGAVIQSLLGNSWLTVWIIGIVLYLIATLTED